VVKLKDGRSPDADLLQVMVGAGVAVGVATGGFGAGLRRVCPTPSTTVTSTSTMSPAPLRRIEVLPFINEFMRCLAEIDHAGSSPTHFSSSSLSFGPQIDGILDRLIIPV
jgi:hypothetical protein